MNKEDELGIFTSRGKILIYIVKKPGTTVKNLAKDLFLTRRTIWGGVGELRRMGYISSTTQKGSRNEFCYSVSPLGLNKLRELIGEE